MVRMVVFPGGHSTLRPRTPKRVDDIFLLYPLFLSPFIYSSTISLPFQLLAQVLPIYSPIPAFFFSLSFNSTKWYDVNEFYFLQSTDVLAVNSPSTIYWCFLSWSKTRRIRKIVSRDTSHCGTRRRMRQDKDLLCRWYARSLLCYFRFDFFGKTSVCAFSSDQILDS